MVMPNNYREALRVFQVEYFSTLQKLHQRNMVQISKTSGINRSHLYRTMKKLGLIQSRMK